MVLAFGRLPPQIGLGVDQEGVVLGCGQVDELGVGMEPEGLKA